MIDDIPSLYQEGGSRELTTRQLEFLTLVLMHDNTCTFFVIPDKYMCIKGKISLMQYETYAMHMS